MLDAAQCAAAKPKVGQSRSFLGPPATSSTTHLLGHMLTPLPQFPHLEMCCRAFSGLVAEEQAGVSPAFLRNLHSRGCAHVQNDL